MSQPVRTHISTPLTGTILGVALAVGGVVPAAAADGGVATFDSLQAAFADPQGGEVRLAGDVEAPEAVLGLADGADLTLDLGGSELRVGSIELGTGSALTITDTAPAPGEGVPARLVADARDLPGHAGIRTSGAALTITGNATVEAYGAGGGSGAGDGSAGIGGRFGDEQLGDAGTIEIGGAARVLAAGNRAGAGIGGAYAMDGADVRITGSAQVTALNNTYPGGERSSAVGAGREGGSFGTLDIGAGATLFIGGASIPGGASDDKRGVLEIPEGAVITGSGHLRPSPIGSAYVRNEGAVALPVENVDPDLEWYGNDFVVTFEPEHGLEPIEMRVLGPTIRSIGRSLPVPEYPGLVLHGWVMFDEDTRLTGDRTVAPRWASVDAIGTVTQAHLLDETLLADVPTTVRVSVRADTVRRGARVEGTVDVFVDDVPITTDPVPLVDGIADVPWTPSAHHAYAASVLVTAIFTPAGPDLVGSDVQVAATVDSHPQQDTEIDIVVCPEPVAGLGSVVVATVRAVDTGTGATAVPTGSVELSVGEVSLGTRDVDEQGAAWLAWTPDASGAHAVQAQFVPDDESRWAASAGATSVHVAPEGSLRATTTSAVLRPERLSVGSAATVDVSVGPRCSALAGPAGTVRVVQAGQAVGASAPVGADGTARLEWVAPEVGRHELLIEFTPDDGTQWAASSVTVDVLVEGGPPGPDGEGGPDDPGSPGPDGDGAPDEPDPGPTEPPTMPETMPETVPETMPETVPDQPTGGSPSDLDAPVDEQGSSEAAPSTAGSPGVPEDPDEPTSARVSAGGAVTRTGSTALPLLVGALGLALLGVGALRRRRAR
ncbi:hypothetical protein Xcel_1612 [Xylanimonas cellulosilytica DSM 15894]|uniref:Uncharacterized protein n=1 Tax=Xylanimonas cellulosilytica (strain DSM 15894 / JCM 12276 / CECT 5975 / KCTC 9989 / LMG 20990 / NBRC 107835 / XIL07) TaxID=446471 RepID=D1BSE5_XYLCX|nr:Ig-like domain-containing protein [Xylanimonas cellulosilytica]ACZ30637.1 hypothetical protein Xcel_1612 [Xylanimonas cellulosilytica DSM 15894]